MSNKTIVRKVYPYFHALVLILAIMGIVNCFVAVPDVYELVVTFIQELDPLAVFRGKEGLDPIDFSNF